MKILKAKFIILCNESFEVLQNSAIAFSDKIEKIAKFDELINEYKDAKIIDFGNDIAMPALINSHIHLEYSANKTNLDYGDFVSWLKSIIANGQTLANSNKDNAIKQAISTQLKAGVSTIGEISSFGLSALHCINSPIRTVYFNEILGSNIAMIEQQWSGFLQRFKTSNELKSDLFIPAISVHSPYSTHIELAKKAINLAKENDMMIATHFMESLDEKRWLESGELPFGIYKEEDTTLYKINEQQAKIIRLIFDLYLQGYGYRRIAAILEDKGHKPPKGEKWNGGSIGKILKHEAYIGIYNYTLGAGTPAEEKFKLDNVYPPIIDNQTWALVQKQRLAKKPKRSKRNRLYLLTGKAVCGSCHKNYVGHSCKTKYYKYYYYRCNGRSMHARNEASCKSKDIQAEKLEKWVLDNIAVFILSDNAIKTILDSVAQRVKSKTNTSQKEIKKLEKEAEKLDSRIENMLDLYDSGKLSKARLNKRTEGLEKQLDNIHIELEQLRKLNNTNIDLAALREFLFKYRKNLDNANLETKKTLIDTFVERVEITNKTIKLVLKVDDTLNTFDNFVSMSNSAVTPTTIYTKNIESDFIKVSKSKTPKNA